MRSRMIATNPLKIQERPIWQRDVLIPTSQPSSFSAQQQVRLASGQNMMFIAKLLKGNGDNTCWTKPPARREGALTHRRAFWVQGGFE